MARKDALLRLHQLLIAKRNSLRGKLAEQFSEVPGHSGGDVGDAANDGAACELDSQLAALESRELRAIDMAIELMRDGRYGQCDHCDKPIPISRLNALPFTPYCIECQRELEATGEGGGELIGDWESAYELEGRLNDRELTLGDIDVAD
ncbi:MAG: TraR/DksA family transcriptional regulator [Planctomycetaceae bacterium]